MLPAHRLGRRLEQVHADGRASLRDGEHAAGVAVVPLFLHHQMTILASQFQMMAARPSRGQITD